MKLAVYNDIAEVFKHNNFHNIKVMIDDFPINLKTKGKKEYLDELGNEIDELTFVNFLMYQTHGSDYINFEYLIYYYKLNQDLNNMIIFTNKFLYTDVKKEPLYIWWILNILEEHPMYSKYMKTLMKISPQKRLEVGVLCTRENYKYDASLDELDIAFECNETHHKLTKEKIKDSEKEALVKFHGKALISLITDNVVDVKKIKQFHYKSILYNNDICEELMKIISFEITNQKIKINSRLIESKLKSMIKYILKFKDINNNAYNNYYSKEDKRKILGIITEKLDDFVFSKINTDISNSILNSTYLKKFRNDLCDKILCSALKHYEFRQDYITIIFKESVIDMLTENINGLEYMINNEILYNYDNQKYIKLKTKKIEYINTIKNTLDICITDPEIIIKFFKIKTESIKNPNNNCVITIYIIIEFIKIDKKDIPLLRIILNLVCNISLDILDKDVAISWENFAILLEYYDKNPELCAILKIYYTMLDTMYENIIARIKAHDDSIISTSNDYYKYMHRIQKKEVNKCDKVICEINKLDISNINKKHIKNIISKNTILLYKTNKTNNEFGESSDESDDEITPVSNLNNNIENTNKDFKTYALNDLEKINRTNIEGRVNNLYKKYDLLINSDTTFITVKEESELDEEELKIIDHSSDFSGDEDDELI
jgi:hypothetical protein